MLQVIGEFSGGEREGFALDEIASKANDIVVRRFGPHEISPHRGRVASVDVVSGDIEIGDNANDTIVALVFRRPQRIVYSFRIGGGTLFRLGEFRERKSRLGAVRD